MLSISQNAVARQSFNWV